ncbi:hypothetical protein YSKK_00740 [Halopseudomonas aestusnigri]|nr:hypothetical protein YSKK_00740 [Halopseudomonas aestusnigri]
MASLDDERVLDDAEYTSSLDEAPRAVSEPVDREAVELTNEIEPDESVAAIAESAADEEAPVWSSAADSDGLGVVASEPEPEHEATGGMDPVLLDIFRNETRNHIDQINAYLRECHEYGTPRALSDALQRALHTLKGSAHMAGIQPIALLATPLEKLTKDFKANLVPADQALVELLGDAVTLFEAGLEQLVQAPQAPLSGTDAFLRRIEQLREQGLSARDSGRTDLDRAAGADLMSIFLTEGIDLLLDVSDDLNMRSAGSTPEFDSGELAASLRALAEVAAEVELAPLERLADTLEQVHERLGAGTLALDEAVLDALAAAHERLISMMDQVAAHQHLLPADAELRALQVLIPGALAEQPATASASAPAAPAGGSWSLSEAGTDAELVDIFLEEAQEIIDSAAASLQQWIADPGNTLAVEALQRDLHTLKGGARMAEIRPVGDLAHEMEFVYEGLCDQRYEPSDGLIALLHACHDALAEMIEGVVASRPISDGAALIAAINGFRKNPNTVPTLPDNEAVASPQPEERPLESPVASPMQGMLGMFVEEARELLAPCDGLFAAKDNDAAAAANLLHRVQTLKGSARLAGQHALAEQAKRLEGALIDGSAQASELAALHGAVADLAPEAEEPASLPASAPASSPVTSPVASAPQRDVPAAPAEGMSLAEVNAVLKQAMESSGPTSADSSKRAAAQESVKVSAALLEELVNLAGETSIFRGRIEQQVTDVAQILEDVESTIDRVRDQLRRLDMETQAQILSRHQDQMGPGYEDFDPLEMDQYSQLQQLSRSLFESASDLLDLKETLATRSRDAETLLLQQARVNTELQEGLMRTRMVPFERLVPRLRRVVRQVASELGKQVDIVIGNAEGEMDRSVLERMIGPLEHMLRNAVDHGIEAPAQREAVGKAREGRIRLDLQREGGEIVLTLQDDGAGINLEAVRRKAIERGLMDAETELTDQEVLQYILEAGFSTAEKVTQISGRGVGMDVVNAEVKQLGGSMTLTTEPGNGSTFTIRLPFTVSVNRALMVYSGEDLYAIPLNTIEGIVRVSGYELEAYYAPDAPPFEYAGKTYDLRYLGDLLVTGQQPKLSGHSLPLPVILVRGVEHSVAVQVDALAGSREIVVKNLGKQFAVVPGISGATILGDGRVVVILDLLAVIRAQQAQQAQLQLAAERAALVGEYEEERPTLVMVVDDSITVRKVTSRLLERNGMEVVTAKDGVEAIAKLQDITPDIMLLDIEMPRMDGFEVATLVRHDPRLEKLPIVMITSRTGEKHRERALGIGVNVYLGKPYQESQLLEVIDQLVESGD